MFWEILKRDCAQEQVLLTPGGLMCFPFRLLPSFSAVQGTLSGQAAVAKCHRLGGLNHRHLFLTVWEAGMSKIKVLAAMAERDYSLSSSSYKATNSIIRTPRSWPHLTLINFQTSYLQTQSHWGMGLQHKSFGEDTLHFSAYPQVVTCCAASAGMWAPAGRAGTWLLLPSLLGRLTSAWSCCPTKNHNVRSMSIVTFLHVVI